MDPLVSIVIPFFNLGQYVEETVQSIFSQTYPHIEIILVNDGSFEPDSLQALERLRKNPRLRVVDSMNQGLPSARNLGIRISKGKYISCIDADDLYCPEFIEKAVQVLEGDQLSHIGFVTSHIKIFGHTDRIWAPGDFNPIEIIKGNIAHVSSLYRRTTWEEVGGYNPELIGYQDWNFWMNIVSRGYVWHTIPEVLFQYRDRPGSMISKSNQKKEGLLRQVYDLNKDFVKENSISVVVELKKTIESLEAKIQEHIAYQRQLEAKIQEHIAYQQTAETKI